MNLTPAYTRGVVLTHDGTTVDLRSRLVRCTLWDGLTGRGAFLGSDEKLPDFPGLDPGLRSPGGLTARMDITIDGQWTKAGAKVSTSVSDRRDNMLETLRELQDFMDAGELLDVTVHEDLNYTGKLWIEDPGRPSTMAWRCDLVVEVSVPAGRLVTT